MHVILQCWISDLGETAEAHAHSPEICHIHRRRSFFTVCSLLLLMHPIYSQHGSVDGTTHSTVSHTARRLSRAHASDERVHAAGGQRVHALTRCVANINQDNRRILRLSSVGSLPLAKNALHSPTSIFEISSHGIENIKDRATAATMKMAPTTVGFEIN